MVRRKGRDHDVCLAYPEVLPVLSEANAMICECCWWGAGQPFLSELLSQSPEPAIFTGTSGTATALVSPQKVKV